MKIIRESSFAHFGIKGMKWGRRRYQNKDGSLTPAGKKRYSNENVTKLSDDVLIKRINRMRLEKEYTRLLNETNYSDDKKTSLGKKYAKNVNKSVITPVLVKTGQMLLQDAISEGAKKTLNVDIKYKKK